MNQKQFVFMFSCVSYTIGMRCHWCVGMCQVTALEEALQQTALGSAGIEQSGEVKVEKLQVLLGEDPE